jgi:cbb3-type cytochrome oxidase maturation protein
MPHGKTEEMYYPFYLAYMLAGFVISLAVFFWALNRGQFRDQQRARFLPLEDRPAEGPVKLTRFGRWQTIFLFILAGAGLTATAVAIVLSLIIAGRN